MKWRDVARMQSLLSLLMAPQPAVIHTPNSPQSLPPPLHTVGCSHAPPMSMYFACQSSPAPHAASKKIRPIGTAAAAPLRTPRVTHQYKKYSSMLFTCLQPPTAAEQSGQNSTAQELKSHAKCLVEGYMEVQSLGCP